MTDRAEAQQAALKTQATSEPKQHYGVDPEAIERVQPDERNPETPCRGVLFIMVGPSGAGKNTVMEKVIETLPGLRQMPTATTRAKRGNEVHGKQHYFMTVADFKQLITEDAFIEHQEVHEGKFYGTLRSEIETAFYKNHEMLMADIDIFGASALKKALGPDVVLIFIKPPSMDILEERLRKRAEIDKVTETEIQKRLERARLEMPFADECDFVVINHEIPQATSDVLQIVMEQARKRGCL